MEQGYNPGELESENKTEQNAGTNSEPISQSAPENGAEQTQVRETPAYGSQPQNGAFTPPPFNQQPQNYGGFQAYNGPYNPYDPSRRVVNEMPYRSENPYAQSPYQQNFNSQQEKKPAKKHTGVKVIAVILAAIILVGAGVAGGVVLSKRFGSQPAQTTTTDQKPSGSGKTVQPIPEDKDPVFVPSSGDTLDTFNASEIYKNN
ncbi:MAG: hypothetical protein IJV00_04345, partial [Clostridia bacterium]|nr:hypothetical protein [Clostridia bacterium]